MGVEASRRAANQVLLRKLVVQEEENPNLNRKLQNDFGGIDLLCQAFTGIQNEVPSTFQVNCTSDTFGKLTLSFEDTATEPTCDTVTITDSEDGTESSVEQCIQDLEMKITLDLLSSSAGGGSDINSGTSMEVDMCVTLGTGFPDDVVGIRFCFGIDGEVIIANTGVIAGDGGDVGEGLDDAFNIKSCTATSDTTDCNCQVCDDGDGVTFDCMNSLTTDQECSDFDGIEDFTKGGGTTVVNQLLEPDAKTETTDGNNQGGGGEGSGSGNEENMNGSSGSSTRMVSSSSILLLVAVWMMSTVSTIIII